MSFHNWKARCKGIAEFPIFEFLDKRRTFRNFLSLQVALENSDGRDITIVHIRLKIEDLLYSV
jgi:hypothetical protein